MLPQTNTQTSNKETLTCKLTCLITKANSSLFGRDLSACLPNVSRRRDRVAGKLEWNYMGLGLIGLNCS